MNKLFARVIISILVASLIIAPTATASAATTDDLTLSLTSTFKVLDNAIGSGSYEGDGEVSLEKDSDGVYTLTIYSGQTVAIKCKRTSGYYVQGTSNKSIYVTAYPGSLSLYEQPSNYVVITGQRQMEEDDEIVTKTVKLRLYKYVKSGKYRTLKAFGSTVKLKVVIKPLVPKGTYSEELTQEFLDAYNPDRAVAGVNQVTITDEAQAYAETRAKELQEYAYSHQRPDGLTKYYGECIDRSVVGASGKSIWQDFKDSDQHYGALMHSDIVEFGIGVYIYGEVIYVSVNFELESDVVYDDPIFSGEDTSWEDELSTTSTN